MRNAAVCWALAFSVGLGACGAAETDGPSQEVRERREKALAERLKAACASDATYDRLKQVVFDEAIQVRNADPVNLDLLASSSLVRVENPVVKSRDETLDVTVCSGRFILQVPPGAEPAFSGKHQLVADIEYAAQAASDGSGLVYQIRGAEPIIYSLAAFDLRAESFRPPPAASGGPDLAQADRTAAPLESDAREITPLPLESEARETTRLPRSAPRPARSTANPPRTDPQPVPTERAEASSPSFNCRLGRARTEQMVCNSQRLASLDREMSAQFYSELSRADGQVRAELRRSRDRFLAYRERCPDESCVEQAYLDRMDEIDDIAGGL